MMSDTSKTCKNCDAPIELAYCSSCGQCLLSVPFTFKSTIAWIADLIDFNKGYFWTLYALLVKPNRLITDFLKGKTRNYINPVKCLIITVAGLFLITKTADYLSASGTENGEDESVMYILAFLFVGFIYAFNLILFFKSKYNKLEHLIIVVYESSTFLILAVPSLIIIKSILIGEADSELYAIHLWSIFMISYHSFYLKKIYGGHTVLVIIKSIFSVIASFILISLVANSFDIPGT